MGAIFAEESVPTVTRVAVLDKKARRSDGLGWGVYE